MKHNNVVWLISLSLAILLICLVGFIRAGHDDRSSYWKNKIALAPDDSFINQELLPVFLTATESFPTDTMNGEPIVGAIRRSFTDEETVGWLLEVIDKAEVVRGDNVKTLYAIQTSMVFDLGTGEKK